MASPAWKAPFMPLGFHGGFVPYLGCRWREGGEGLVGMFSPSRVSEPEDADKHHRPRWKSLSSCFSPQQIKRWKKWLEMYHPHVESSAQEGLGSGPPHTIQLVLVFRQDLLNTCKPCVSVWILFVQITSSVVKLFLSDPRLQICALYSPLFYPWISTSISSHSEYETVKEGAELGSKSQENLQRKTLSKTHGTGQESSLALLHPSQWGRPWAAVNSHKTARSTGAASIYITWPNSLVQRCNISPALVGFLLIYTPPASKQSQGLSSPIRSAPQLYLPSVMSSKSKHKATAETGCEEAGGQSFMIDVLLESYKKKKCVSHISWRYFMRKFNMNPLLVKLLRDLCTSVYKTHYRTTMNKFIKTTWAPVDITNHTSACSDLISLSLYFRLPTCSFSLYIFHCYKNSTPGQISQINLLVCLGNMALVLILQTSFRQYSLWLQGFLPE